MLIVPPAGLVRLFEPWASFYGDSSLTQTVVTFAHVGGLLIAGGIAIATDRGTLRAAGLDEAGRRRHLEEMALLHRTVIAGLVTIILSGLMLLSADLETFWSSWIYWAKMLLIVMLLANGARMQRAERRLRDDPAATAPHWNALRSSAMASLALWLTISFAGVALINYA